MNASLPRFAGTPRSAVWSDFIPPSAVAWFRGIVLANIEFTANGVLTVAFGDQVPERLDRGMPASSFDSVFRHGFVLPPGAHLNAGGDFPFPQPR